MDLFEKEGREKSWILLSVPVHMSALYLNSYASYNNGECGLPYGNRKRHRLCIRYLTA